MGRNDGLVVEQSELQVEQFQKRNNQTQATEIFTEGTPSWSDPNV